MAAEVGKVYPTDVHLLKQELAAQGDLLDQERLERRAEVDELRLEINVLKRLLDQARPGILGRYDELLAEERQTWNPDLRKKEA
jgi:hypothetical protein